MKHLLPERMTLSSRAEISKEDDPFIAPFPEPPLKDATYLLAPSIKCSRFGTVHHILFK